MSVLCFGMSHDVYTVSWSSEGSWQPFHIAPNSVCAAWWERRKQKTTDFRMWKFVSPAQSWKSLKHCRSAGELQWRKVSNLREYLKAGIRFVHKLSMATLLSALIDIWKVTIRYWWNKSCDINRSVWGVLTLQGSWISSLNSPIFNFQLMTRLISIQNKAGARVRV